MVCLDLILCLVRELGVKIGDFRGWWFSCVISLNNRWEVEILLLEVF